MTSFGLRRGFLNRHYGGLTEAPSLHPNPPTPAVERLTAVLFRPTCRLAPCLTLPPTATRSWTIFTAAASQTPTAGSRTRPLRRPSRGRRRRIASVVLS